MNFFLSALKEYKPLVKFWLIFLFIALLIRTALSITFLENIDTNFFIGLLYGFRMDTIYFSFFGIIFSILYALNFIRTSQIFLTSVFLLYIFLEIMTFGFMGEFLTRPNSLFVEHLKNYDEILVMIWKLYTVYIIPLLILLVIVTYFVYKFVKNSIERGNIKQKVIVLPLIIVLLFVGVRSSLDTSTPNQSFYTFSNNDLNNELANNSAISIVYSIYLFNGEREIL